MNPISIHEDSGLIPGPIQWVKDLVLLWLCCRLAAPIRPLAWELPYAEGEALNKQTNIYIYIYIYMNIYIYVQVCKKLEAKEDLWHLD